jgi:Protein of unknown function (DUF3631)
MKRIRIVRDGDPEGSPADTALQAGIDNLILQGAAVTVTNTPSGADSNSLLQDKGVPGLLQLLGSARPATLSFSAALGREVQRLAGLDKPAYDRERRDVAKTLGVRLGTLDAEVAKRRPQVTDDASAAGVLSVPEDPPWTGPLPPLATLLETIKTTIGRFVVITQAQAVAITLWVAAAHLLQSPKVNLEIFPKLAVQSKDPASGKTTLLKLIWNLLPRAKLWTFPSGAYLVRAIEQGSPSLCLDELQYAEDKNLLRVINAAHERSLAYVPLLVPDPKGGWIPREFPVWVPMALARLGEFSGAQQSRAIVIWMLPKLRGETREPLRRPEVRELVEVRRQLAGWADAVPAWHEPAIPDVLLNRDFNNWEPLLFTAELAGEGWRSDAHKAVGDLVKLERAPSTTERLLASIWKLYQPDPNEAPTRTFLQSTELRDELIADTEEDWADLNHGKPISFEWLGRQLRHLLDPRGPQQENYYDPVTGKRRNRKGYSFAQFQNAFARYIGEHPLADTSSETRASPASPDTPAKNPSKSAAPAEESEAGTEAGQAPEAGVPTSVKPREFSGSDPAQAGEAGEVGPAEVGIGGKDTVSSCAATAETAPAANGEDREATAPGPNGPMSGPKRRTSAIAHIIRQTENPTWSAAQIGKRVGRAPSVVKRILAEGASPDRGQP